MIINNPIRDVNDSKEFKYNKYEKIEDFNVKKRRRILSKKLSKRGLGLYYHKKYRAADDLIDKKSTSNKNTLKKNATKFEIRKSKQEFDPTVNYYIEYWKMFNENEYILAKIKENLYEINNMKGHLQELKALNEDNN